MAVAGLIKSLAEREQELAKELEQASQLASVKVRDAEAKARKLVEAAEQAVKDLEARYRIQIADAVAKIEAEAKTRAQAEAGQIVNAAGPKVAMAVQEVLREVLP